MTALEGGHLMVRGRTFSPSELLQVREIVESMPHEHRRGLSRRVCELLCWYQENGRLKDRSCRELLARLERAGFLKLPPRRRSPTFRRPIPLTNRTSPRLAFPVRPREISPASFHIVKSQPEEGLWNEYIERYHYLKFGVVVGPRIKYFVQIRGVPVALLSFGGAAWKVEPRDRWIGWTAEQRKSNLRFVVNNTRFLVLPWISVKNLASRILSLAAKRLPEDWAHAYGYKPCLIETFVHVDRHAGTCYKAANWIALGETKGRGKMDRFNEAKLPRKLVYVYPLAPNARTVLTQERTTQPLHS